MRQDGILTAIKQSTRYVRRRLFGWRPSVLGWQLDGPMQGPERYLHGVWRTLAQNDAFHIMTSPALLRNRRQIAMIADLNLPQCRKYRVEQLAAFWRARGVEFEFTHYQDVQRATRIMQTATHLMEYRLQADTASEMLRYEAHRLRLPILYDLDDPLFSVSAYETYGNMDVLDPAAKAHFLNDAPKYLSMMNGADVVSVSTPGMATHLGLYSNRPVYLRRNFADTPTLEAGTRAMQEERPTDGIFRVAFASGSQGHEADFAEILAPLTEFILEDRNRRLMLIGHFNPKHFPKALVPQIEPTKFTSYERYLSTLRRADCAVMPLCDDIFNSCKSGVRVIDAAAVAVPSIVGTVGDLPELVMHEATGFIAKGAADWTTSLRALADDPSAAVHMGQAARLNLEQRWQASDQPHIIAPELIDWVAA
ncbi:MAG: glycosyltransferase [Sulfitobacter sp.]